ncbi:MAG: hypothetical protein K9L68_06145 [Spirochaetales bacterium]|nr:hypothetical protein [Spirochaetales bacterium]MCF7938163.1 hypothetical protein [Spirochaetales bacterium]
MKQRDQQSTASIITPDLKKVRTPNALKENIKRVYFRDRRLDIDDPVDYAFGKTSRCRSPSPRASRTSLSSFLYSRLQKPANGSGLRICLTDKL